MGILEKGFFHEMEERQYFSIEQLNRDLWDFLKQRNREPFKKQEHSRYFYREEECQELMPLPTVHYEYTERRAAKVSSGFHVRFDNSYCSVNKAYVHKEMLISTSPAHLPVNFLLHTIENEAEIRILFALLEGRSEKKRSTIVCSQRAPEN